MRDDRRFGISASAIPTNRYTLAELDLMADEMLTTATRQAAPPKTISDLNHDDIWKAWNAPKGGRS